MTEVFCRVDRTTGIPGLRAGLWGTIVREGPTWVRVSFDNGHFESLHRGEYWMLPENTREPRRAFLEACRLKGLDTLQPTPTTAIRKIIAEYAPDLKRTPFEELTAADWERLEQAVSERKAVNGGVRLRLKIGKA